VNLLNEKTFRDRGSGVMIFSLFKSKNEEVSPYEDEFKILKSEKKVNKIKSKLWTKYMQELLKKNTNSQLKKLFMKEHKSMTEKFKTRYNGINSVFFKMLSSSHNSEDASSVNVKKEIKELTNKEIFIFIKKMSYLHNLDNEINMKYENVFYLLTYTWAEAARNDKELAKLFRIKI